MINKVLETIKENKLISEFDNIVIGVSGGPDSMALLNVLYDLKETLKINLYVAHINHTTREGESDLDEEYVKKYCEDLHIKFFTKKINLKKYSKENKISEEEAGRILRYKFFRSIIKDIGNGKIAVAHNKNDQAETLILRLIRGSGIDGLRGMEYLNNDIIRPLLDITRYEIESYLSNKKIDARIDKTNLKPIYSRNKVRLELLPYIHKNFNENIIDTLSRTSNIMRIDSEYLNNEALNHFDKVVVSIDVDKIIFDSNKFNLLHLAMKNRIIRIGYEKIYGSIKNLEEKHINNVIELVNGSKTGKSIDLSNNIIVYNQYNNFVMEKNKINYKKEFNYKINIDEELYVNELNINVKTRILNNKINIYENNPFIKYFDYDKIINGIYIRNKKNGDRFIPLGMNGKKKIKDYFIDEKIPREERDNIAIIHDDSNILWIVGYRISELYKIDKDTKNILEIEVTRKGN